MLKQLNWPELTVRGQNAANEAYGRELGRLLHFRRIGLVRREGGGFEFRISEAIRDRIRREWQEEYPLLNVAVDDDIADAYQENDE